MTPKITQPQMSDTREVLSLTNRFVNLSVLFTTKVCGMIEFLKQVYSRYSYIN